MTLRLFVDAPAPLATGQVLDLPPGPARHVQVRRLQPGDALTVFDGRGGEWAATVQQMGRSQVTVLVGTHDPVEREAPCAVTLAVGMPANDRMDWLVEKATELGVAEIRPLVTERSVLRLDGERAERKRQHWQAVAVAAAEQCGRTRVPMVHPVRALAGTEALPSAGAGGQGWVLSVAPGAKPASVLRSMSGPHWLLSGPEGGLTDGELARALAAGAQALSLGPRVLRAETAPLAALALLTAV
ncbi:16S rRNA (uracil(1498)-N(3))-methyltransferase [Rubrivivax albus]|uniref:Ribosomal RNA small subunit methyltransferase E n=1 Tax=Rubrivivax albus TaxID=2499835 RepID=A0A437JY51_9BURK|nr:16S rRNA (uracil(1498)-N(3))-methyltransferase [Rubrivivax albus]RVT52545.1 16S rRNA (uracil(1498)-N(3))-methyltransferase [Rubrivivax albus]